MSLAADFSNKVPQRNKNRIRMEVESVTMQCLPSGNLVLPGKAEIVIYEDEEQQVLDLVRDEEENIAVQQAYKQFEIRLKRYADEKCGGDLEKARLICPESPQSVFCLLNDGKPHMRPLLSATTIARDLPPPHKQEAWSASNDTANMVATAISLVMNDPSLRKVLAEQLKDEILEQATKPELKTKGK